jgi:hypothetical protein
MYAWLGFVTNCRLWLLLQPSADLNLSLTQPASDLLAADYGCAFTGWANAFHPPTLAGVAGAGSDAPATKIAGNVSLQSPVSPPSGNALGCAVCCGLHD